MTIEHLREDISNLKNIRELIIRMSKIDRTEYIVEALTINEIIKEKESKIHEIMR